MDYLEVPKNWVVFTVANIGGHCRPLDVTCLVEEKPGMGIDGSVIVSFCERAITLFQDATSRDALYSELATAELHYHTEQTCTQFLPPTHLLYRVESESTNPHFRREFPFISTCIMLIANASHRSRLHVLPLGAIFQQETHFYGVIVLDVSDPELIKYGISAVGMGDHPTEWLSSAQLLRLNDLRGRPRSARDFVAEFGIEDVETELSALDRSPVISTISYERVWPLLYIVEPTAFNALLQPRPPGIPGDFRLSDMCKALMFDDTYHGPEIDNRVLRNTNIPWLKPCFLEFLEEVGNPDPQKMWRRTSHLLAVAFSGTTHLNLVKVKKLTAKAIEAALEMEELKDVTSISICVDHFVDTNKNMAKMLVKLAPRYDIYVCQKPTKFTQYPRGDQSSQILAIQADLRTRSLQSKSMFVTALYEEGILSQPMPEWSKVYWHRLEDYMQYVYCKNTICSLTVSGVWQNQAPDVWYVRNTAIPSRRFVGGFFKWLSRPEDGNALDFASGPSTYEDLSKMTANPIPPRSMYLSAAPGHIKRILKGSWHLLLHKTKMSEDRNGMFTRSICYAFVKALTDFTVHDWAEKLERPQAVMEIHSIQGFLGATTGKALDPEERQLIDRQLAVISASIDGGWGCDRFGILMLSREEAADLFRSLVVVSLGLEDAPVPDYPISSSCNCGWGDSCEDY